MKAIIMMLVVAGTMNAWANDTERVILSDSKTFPTEVSNTTVRCSDLGYGSSQLKINLAGLDGWTLFDHTNAQVGEFGEPCMAAGMCNRGPEGEAASIARVVQNNPGSEIVTISRIVTEHKTESKDLNGVEFCNRSLSESLSATIRGIKFKHLRSGANERFPIEVCRK